MGSFCADCLHANAEGEKDDCQKKSSVRAAIETAIRFQLYVHQLPIIAPRDVHNQ